MPRNGRPKLGQSARNYHSAPADCPLSRHELAALQGVADGKQLATIAHETGRARSTIRTQVHNACLRLGKRNSVSAVIHCWIHGWLTIDGHHVRDHDPPLPQPVPQPKPVDPLITPAHRVGLYAFDLFLKAHDPDEQQAAKTIMTRAFQDAGIPINPTRADRGPDLIRMIAAATHRWKAEHATDQRRRPQYAAEHLA